LTSYFPDTLRKQIIGTFSGS